VEKEVYLFILVLVPVMLGVKDFKESGGKIASSDRTNYSYFTKCTVNVNVIIVTGNLIYFTKNCLHFHLI
jgi:hypothetical protein